MEPMLPNSSPTAALDALADRAVGVAEAALFLGYSKTQVRKLERLGLLPPLPRRCNRVTFDPRVLRAFRDGSLQAVKPLQQDRSRGVR
jgi:hypothetical protein